MYLLRYSSPASVEVLGTAEFQRWLESLRHVKARLGRIRRLLDGNPGDTRSVGRGISEMRIHGGPAYRVYFVKRGFTRYVLLTGGTKRSQSAHIARARLLAHDANGELDGQGYAHPL